MNKYKYLIKNIGLLTISSFGTKILSFVLIPIYTSCLSTAEYGTYDIFSTTISLLTPILTLNIIESVMRFSLEKSYKAEDVFSVGLKFILRAFCIIVALSLTNYCFGIFAIINDYAIWFPLLFLGSVCYSLCSQFSRGIERVADVAIAGAINSVIMLSLNVLFLVVFKIGLNGYFAANCLAYYIPTIYYILRLRLWRYIKFNKDELPVKDEMVSYSKPLIFNTIAWWINNVSDRYIVTWICGVAANGIYSVAYKIPSILNIFQSIFSQAWTLSAVKEFNKDSGRFYSNIYKTYNAGMVIVCSMLILGDRIIARILYANEFYNAWKYAPFLMISVVFGSLSGMLGGVFSAAKQSKVFAKTTVAGASVNTILNLILVYLIGPLGASVATLISYILVWYARIIEVNKIIKLDVKYKRDILTYFLLIIQGLGWYISIPIYLLYSLELLLLIIILLLYRNDAIDIVRSLKNKNKK